MGNIPSLNLVDPAKISDEEKQWSGPFTFVHATDIGMGILDKFLFVDDPNWDKEKALVTESVKRINEMKPKPKFFIICGNMLGAFLYKDTSGDIRRKQYADLVDILKSLDPEIKLVFVCGRYDCGNPPAPDAVQIYRTQFGQEYFKFCYGGVLFVVLTSQYYLFPDKMPYETGKQSQLIDELANSMNPKPKHIVVFQYDPFFLQHPDEENNFASILKEVRLPILEKFYNLGVRYVFSGRYLGNCGGFYKDMEQVVTAALGAPLRCDPSGHRVVNVFEDRISHEFVPFFKDQKEQKSKNFMP